MDQSGASVCVAESMTFSRGREGEVSATKEKKVMD